MTIQKKQLSKRTEEIVFFFLVGAMAGWIYEVFLHLITNGDFVNRGILHGPWLPIYGIGCVLMVGLKKWTGNNPLTYFFVCVTASGVLEYSTSWLMEIIYHKRWWDYSELPLNLHGRIFAGGLVGFGLAGCLFAYLVFPAIMKKYKSIPDHIKKVFSAILAFIFVLDMLISLFFPNVGTGITNTL